MLSCKDFVEKVSAGGINNTDNDREAAEMPPSNVALSMAMSISAYATLVRTIIF